MSVALVYVRQSRTTESQRTISPQIQEKECRNLEAVKACDVVKVCRYTYARQFVTPQRRVLSLLCNPLPSCSSRLPTPLSVWCWKP